MYKIYLDDSTLYYPGDEKCIVYDAVVKLKVGQAGSFECIVPPTNPLYGAIYNRKSMISVYRGTKMIFLGEVRESTRDKNNCKNVYAVGELAFLLDSIQPQHNYGNITPTAFLTAVIAEHNSQVEEKKQFTFGYSTVPQGYDTTDKITDFDDSLTALRENLVNNLGGCLRVRHSGNVRYLDYVPLASYGSANTQGINFGENLLDYAENMTASDIVTCVIPLGARLDSDSEFETRLDITSVNSGKNYLTASTALLSRFGKVWKVVVFDGIESASTLKTAGQAWLAENLSETMTLKVSAVDLSMLDSTLDDMNLGDRIPCYAPPYGLDTTLPILEQTLNLMAPQKDTITLSATIKNKKQTISGQVSSGTNDIKQATYKQEQKIRAVIAQEVANIMATFTGTAGGYKLSEYDDDGLWIRDLYMDAPDKDDATNIMEISMAGIRFSTGGYAAANSSAWTSAWTIGGAFCADFITAGTLMGERVKAGTISDVAGNVSWNLETGAMSADQLSINSTNFTLDTSGNITATSAALTDATITGGKITSSSNEKKSTLENGYYRGYINNSLCGLLDLSPTYSDGYKHAALWGKNILHLQAGGSEGSPSREILVKTDGMHGHFIGDLDGNVEGDLTGVLYGHVYVPASGSAYEQGLTGTYALGDVRVRCVDGMIMEIL